MTNLYLIFLYLLFYQAEPDERDWGDIYEERCSGNLPKEK
jgi:hypothetical protein